MSATANSEATGGADDALVTAMGRAVRSGAPGVLVGVVDGDERRVAAVGVADRATGRPPQAGDHFRAGSITKTFTATLVLQLAAEERLCIDDTVERWLPGAVRGHGHDGRRITLRQLLNHTSGVYNYLNDPSLHQIGPDWLEHRHETCAPERLLAVAMSRPPPAPPGERFVYANTNYLLAAMVVEEVTGASYEHALQARVLDPLGLTGTVSPGVVETVPQPSGRNYSTEQVQLPLPGVDSTEFNPSVLRASGELVSTTDDLNRFFEALLTGELLPEAQLRAMLSVSDRSDDHGLGLTRFTTSHGTALWGQRGGGYGFEAVAVSTRDGRHRMVAYLNTDALALEGRAFRDIVDAEFHRDGS